MAKIARIHGHLESSLGRETSRWLIEALIFGIALALLEMVRGSQNRSDDSALTSPSSEEPMMAHRNPYQAMSLERRSGYMLPYPQLHVRMDTVGEPYTTITLLINEDSLDTLERQLDVLDGLIAHYGARAFFGEPLAEPQRQAS
jgi:hypothetical protein